MQTVKGYKGGYMIGKGYSNANTTKQALEGQPEIKMLNAASERGIYRPTKHDNRKRKRIQHEQNVANRAGNPYKKGK